MAKSRRIANDREIELVSQTDSLGGSSSRSLFTASTGVQIATAMSSAAIVYVAYWPHDSTEVQQGAARYLVAWLLVAAMIAVLSIFRVSRSDAAIDWIAWCIAGWMTVSLVCNSSVANFRLGVNELGWWLGIAALVSVGRRVAVSEKTAISLVRLMIAASIGVAFYAWHQVFVGFPQLIAEYKSNPDAMLRQVGIVAEHGSATRIVFENRLYDGGPTGTFALANSMAVMLVGGLVTMIGTLVTTWRNQSASQNVATRTMQRLLWFGGIAIIGGMILATRSRSAVLSILLLVAWLVISQVNDRQRWFQRIRQKWRAAAAALALSMAVAAGLGYTFRNTEWIQQAPASLAIRFNYWRACFEMVRESPWVGVGPGQFKSRYEQFRAAAASEQIADPHQFLLQTVTTGGIPALLLMIALLILFVWNFPRHSRVAMDHSVPPVKNARDAEVGGVLTGVLIAIGGVWLVGAGLGQMPMFDPGAIGTFAAAGFAVFAWFHFKPPANETDELPTVRSIARYAALAMGIDLLASGGLTVPGVSVIAWMLVGIAVPVLPAEVIQNDVIQNRDCSGKFGWRRVGLASLVFGSLIGWYRCGIEPLEKARMLQNRFEVSWSRGQVDAAIASLEEATREDRWDAEPWLQLAAVCRSLAIEQPDRRMEWQQKWLAAEQEAIRRNSRDPVLLRQLGDGRILFYQRYGDRRMLEAANQLFEKAVNLSPSHETYTAQWAEILRELGDERAQPVAVQALKLSRSGGYYERSLDFTMILTAKFNQSSTSESRSQMPAAAVLANLLPKAE